MSATATRMTAAQYYAVTVEGDRKQLVDGQLVVNDPKLIHGVLQWRLGGALYAWVQAGQGRGICSMPTDVRMDEFNVYGPDLVWIAEEHLPPDLNRYPERVPDLCVEIRSSSTWRYDVGVKKSVYERGGLPELWLVDSVAETVLVFRRSTRGVDRFDVAFELGGGETLEPPRLPGFALSMDDLFRH